MDLEARVKTLELAYAGIQADAIRLFDQEGILEKVTEQKYREQLAMGKRQAEQFGIKKPEEVFKRLSEIFNCAVWEIGEGEDGFTAVSHACKLYAVAQRAGKVSPCRIYCLNPMEGMVKGLDPDGTFEVKSTLWDGPRCEIRVGTALYK